MEKRVSYEGQPVGIASDKVARALTLDIQTAKAKDIAHARGIIDAAIQGNEIADDYLPEALDFMRRSSDKMSEQREQLAKMNAQFTRGNNITKGSAPAYIASTGDTPSGLVKRFSLSRAVTNVLDGKQQDGAESEIIAEGRNQFAGAAGQIVVPDWAAREMRNVYGTDAGLSGIDGAVTGLQTLAPTGMGLALHGQPLAQQLGAQVIDGIGGQTIVLPWLGRTDAAVTEEGGDSSSVGSFQSVSLTPTRYSRQLTVSALSLRTTPGQMDAVIMQDFQNAVTAAQDKQAFAAIQSAAGWTQATAANTNDLAATSMADLHELVSDFMDTTGRNEYPNLIVSRLGAKALNTGLSGSDTTLAERYTAQTGARIIPAVNLVDGNITSANAVGGTGTIAGAGVVLAGNFDHVVIVRFGGIDLLVAGFGSNAAAHNVSLHANAYSAAGVLNNAFNQLAVSPAEIAAS